MVRFCINKVTYLTTEAYSKFGGMGSLNYFLTGKLTQEPSGQQERRKLTLSMTGWHVNDEALALTLSHTLERISHLGVVPTTNK